MRQTQEVRRPALPESRPSGGKVWPVGSTAALVRCSTHAGGHQVARQLDPLDQPGGESLIVETSTCLGVVMATTI